MICPFCQHELDVEAMACPRCSAVYPQQKGMTFRFKVRTMIVSGAMMLLTSLILVDCVLNSIESSSIVPECTKHSTGGNCMITTRQMWMSPQTSQFGGPDMKSPGLQQLLRSWQQNEQPTQNITPPLPNKKPTR